MRYETKNGIVLLWLIWQGILKIWESFETLSFSQQMPTIPDDTGGRLQRLYQCCVYKCKRFDMLYQFVFLRSLNAFKSKLFFNVN